MLDFACGGGLAGLACARAGASDVLVNDIDPLALVAAKLNASLNGLSVTPLIGDQIDTIPEIDLLLCGDVCYNQQMADRIIRGYAAVRRIWKSGWPIRDALMHQRTASIS